MTRLRIVTSFGAAAALAVGAALFQGNRLQAQDTAAIGQPAPAWKLKDLDGHEVSSDQFKGKVVVVDFWATWCKPCLEEIPGYIALQKKYGPAGLVIVGISVDRLRPELVKKFAQAHAMDYTLVMGDAQVLEAFGSPESFPTTFLINRQGRIVHQKAGLVTHDEYEKIVKQALE